MKKYVPLILVSAFGALLLTSCNPQRTSTNGMPIPGVPETQEKEVMSAASEATATSEATVAPRVIAVTAQSWNFTPNAISVKKGENIVLRVTGKTGVHGLAIPGLGINVPIPLGQTVDVQIPTNNAGTFDFLCSVPCGKGHRDMRGTIVVE